MRLQDSASAGPSTGNVQMIWSLFAFLCSKQRSKEVSKLVLAGEKTQNAQTTEFSKILLSTNFANMLDSLSDLGNLVPRLETVPESHASPDPPWACGDNENTSPCFPCFPAKLSGGIPFCIGSGTSPKMPVVCKSASPAPVNSVETGRFICPRNMVRPKPTPRSKSQDQKANFRAQTRLFVGTFLSFKVTVSI